MKKCNKYLWGKTEMKETFERLVKDEKVLFITTKNIDYIRNTQELRIINKNAQSVEVIASDKKNYLIRILDVWGHISNKKIQNCTMIFIGFEPQFVLPFFGRKLKNKPIIVDFFVSVYDTLVCDRKKLKDGSIGAKFCHWMDAKTIEKANHVITDTKEHADYFVSEFGGNREDFETVYLEADPNIYYSRSQSKPGRLKDKFVVLYFGSVLPLQGVDIVLGAIRELRDREDIYFDIIGPIPKEFNKPLQRNVNYTEWLPQNELAEHIANADLCLAGHFNGEIDKAWRTIPGKAYIYEMMNRPMILGDGKANHELFVEDEFHHFVTMGNGEQLANKILECSRVCDR